MKSIMEEIDKQIGVVSQKIKSFVKVCGGLSQYILSKIKLIPTFKGRIGYTLPSNSIGGQEVLISKKDKKFNPIYEDITQNLPQEAKRKYDLVNAKWMENRE
jgi:hypothetical protein